MPAPSGKTPFRHRPRKKTPMSPRPAGIPPYWCVIDFGGTEKRGRESAPCSTRRMELLRLVLNAEDIPHIIKGHGTQMRAWVPAIYELKARHELADVAAEQAVQPSSPHLIHRNAHRAMLVLLLLLAWHGLRMGWWSTPFDAPDPQSWLDSGSLNAVCVQKGEWWRLATALTLHRDSLHLFSNILFTSPFLIFLAQRMGLGTAAACTLFSSMFANGLNVIYRTCRELPNISIGFSTAMFAIVGILSADSLMQNQRAPLLRRITIPVTAGLAFLAMLGTEGEGTDYPAHVFGLLCGFLSGLALCTTLRHTSINHNVMNLFLGTTTAAAILFCWCLAL